MAERGRIVNQLQEGIPPETVAKDYDWTTLSPIDRKALLAEAKIQGECELGRELHKLLFILSEDDWYTAEVLILAIRNPFLDLTEKLQTLNTLNLRLSKIEKSLYLNPTIKGEKRNIKKFRVRYFYLLGQAQFQSGEIESAIISYQEALTLSLELGAISSAEKLEHYIRELQVLSKPIDEIVNNEILKDEQLLEVNSQQIESNKQQAQEQFLKEETEPIKLDILIKNETEQVAKLLDKINDFSTEAEQLKTKVDYIHETFTQIQNAEKYGKVIEELQFKVTQLSKEIAHKKGDIQKLNHKIKDSEEYLKELNPTILIGENEQSVEELTKPSVVGLEGDVPDFLKG